MVACCPGYYFGMEVDSPAGLIVAAADTLAAVVVGAAVVACFAAQSTISILNPCNQD